MIVSVFYHSFFILTFFHERIFSCAIEISRKNDRRRSKNARKEMGTDLIEQTKWDKKGKLNFPETIISGSDFVHKLRNEQNIILLLRILDNGRPKRSKKQRIQKTCFFFCAHFYNVAWSDACSFFEICDYGTTQTPLFVNYFCKIFPHFWLFVLPFIPILCPKKVKKKR